MPQVDVRTYPAAPNCQERMKSGLLLGLVVGVSIGTFFGVSMAFKHGLRGPDAIRSIGKSIISTSATFGIFMSIGAGIRC